MDVGARRRARIPVMALGGLALVGALLGGLVRLGWVLPVPATLVVFHGPLMVAGFLGTVIGLERAVALGRRWAYAAPLASGAGGLVAVIGPTRMQYRRSIGSVRLLTKLMTALVKELS